MFYFGSFLWFSFLNEFKLIHKIKQWNSSETGLVDRVNSSAANDKRFFYRLICPIWSCVSICPSKSQTDAEIYCTNETSLKKNKWLNSLGKYRTNCGTIHISIWFQFENHIISIVMWLLKWYGSHIETIRKYIWFCS